jgi:hypothetical protein
LKSLLQAEFAVGQNSHVCKGHQQKRTNNNKSNKHKHKHKHSKTSTVVILTAEVILRKGLLLVGFEVCWKRERNILERFETHFGSDPVVCAQIWEDLHPEACVSKKASAVLFLQAIHFMRFHPTEGDGEATFKKMQESTQGRSKKAWE